MKKFCKTLKFILIAGITLIISCSKSESTGQTDQPTQSGNVKDIDGNVYKTVKIGSQIWMAENLNTSKYRDGTPIPYITSNTVWSTLSTGAFCYYNNDVTSNKSTYGALYNCFALKDSHNSAPIHNLAPVGWHVASLKDWQLLQTYLGELSLGGGKLKEAGTSHWLAPNTAATNESGFKALPGGMRSATDGIFYNLGRQANWWIGDVGTSMDNAGNPLSNSVSLFSSSGYLEIGNFGYYMKLGFSVRCVKD